MRVIAVAQVEDKRNLERQLAKQTVKPNATIFHIDDHPAQGIIERRKRIARNHQTLVDAIGYQRPDLIWQLEGDVDLPDNCLEQLLCDYELLRNDDFGYISGIQIGRHGLYVIGAWRNITEDSFESIDHHLTGIQEVEATGFYCLLAPLKVWQSGHAWWDGQPYGPDVNWGLSIKQKKYVNMDLHIGHIVKGGTIWPSHISTTTAKFYKNNGKWEYKTV